jgi:hypothetical protein
MKLFNLPERCVKNFLSLSGGILAFLTLTACSNQLQGVRITTSPELKRASVQVDVVGVTGSSRSAMEHVPVSKYFQAGNALRQTVQAKSMRFGNAQVDSLSVDRSDPLWRAWLDRKSQSIVIMADVPGVFDDLPGEADPRRKILPLSGKEAPAGVVHLEIYQGGIRQTVP